MEKKNQKKKKEKERKGDVWVHTTLVRDLSRILVTHRGDNLLVTLARPVVLGPKVRVMVIPPFKLSGDDNKFIFNVCQVAKILTSISIRRNGSLQSKYLMQARRQS